MNKKFIALISVMIMVFAACAAEGEQGEVGPAGEAGPAGEVSQEAIDAAVEAALAEPEAEVEGTLVIYSGRKESLVADVIAAFEATSGVKVEVSYAKSAALAGNLKLEGEISQADFFLSQDPVSLGFVAKPGLFVGLPADFLDTVPSWAVVKIVFWLVT